MQEKSVTIILLSWNCLSYLVKCLDTLKTKTHFKDYEIMIVDNGSNEATKDYIRQLEASKFISKAIFNETNLGFSKGNNIGISAVKGDVLLLNTDTEILQGDWLKNIQETAYSSDDIGIVGCRQRNSAGFLMHAGSYMLKSVAKGAQIGWGLPDVNQYNSVRQVEGVVGSCMYIKRELIDKIGGLPEEYESYYEDTVYCFKAREAGYKTYCDGRVTILHHQNTATRENKVSFESIYERSRITFAKDWQAKLQTEWKQRVGVRTLAGFPTGYGQAGKNVIVALDRNGVDVRYDYIYGVTKLQGFTDWRLQDVALKPFLDTIPQITFCQGDALHKNTSKAYRIGWTMLEVTGVPKEWVRIMNTLDEVWTCSKFNKDAFIDSGVTKPVHVMPLGIDPEIFNPKINSLIRNPKNKRYTFISCFEYGERKAPEILLKAFNEEFSKKDDVQLLLKINNNDKNLDVYRTIAHLGLKHSRAPIFMLYNTEFYEDTLGAFYKCGDCFVSASMGEGFGMPQLESLACGLPVITTGWSGVTEFLHKDNAYLVDYDLVDAKARCPYYEGFQWARPKIEDLKAKMRYVYENREEAQALALKGSEEMRSKFTWDNTSEKIKDRLKSIGLEGSV